MKRLLVFVAVVWAVSVAQAESAAVRRHRREDRIPGQYIVVLKAPVVSTAAAGPAPSVAATTARHESRYGVRAFRQYQHALRGYAARMSEAAAEALAQDPEVESVEEDFRVRASAVQSGATWGIDRIDQRALPLSGTYGYNFDGTGVHAYIIDTGIFTGHPDFGGRIGNGFTAVNDGNGTNDCNGHGTHVAGTVGSATWGVAKRVTLHPVRVLGCNGSGSGSGVIAGIDWVRANHVKPAVANMSLGGGASTSEDNAVTNAVNAGVVFAVAAGNSNADACGTSPARAAAALTVGSTTSSDARSSFSNWGTCLDVFAPGSAITSTWNNGGTNTISGTSMATPHVTGVAALYMQQFPSSSAVAAAAAIVNNASTGRVGSPGTGSPNRLLYSIFSGGPTPTATTPPRATATPTGARPTATPTNTARPTPTSGGGAPAWQANVSYAVNALVTYGGTTYRCIQAHTSLVGWEPPNVPALWQAQ